MSNVYGVNPIHLDTFTSAIDLGNTLFGDSNFRFKVKKIVWEQPTTEGHTLVIKNYAGNPIWICYASVAYDSYENDDIGWVQGICIDSSGVGSGSVKIFLG